MISVYVEGDTDIPFVQALCKKAGFEVREPIFDAGGKTTLDPKLLGLARAAAGAPYLVLRDLDHDAPCASAWLKGHAPSAPGRFFALRLAVRAVESWFLADAVTAASALHVPVTQIPHDPDAEHDPKTRIVTLARKSTKPDIRKRLVPKPGAKRKAGPEYETWLIQSAARWKLERAHDRSPSLRKALAALVRLREDVCVWEAGT